MPSSSMACTCTMTKFLSCVLFFALMVVTSAQSVQPSNATIPPPTSGVNLNLLLSDGHRIKQDTFVVAPLTDNAGRGQSAVSLQTFNIVGSVKGKNVDSAGSDAKGQIAYISCDPNESNINPSRIIQTTADNKPEAIILFSVQYNACELNGSFNYTTIYTTTTVQDSQFLVSLLNMAEVEGKIATNSSNVPPTPTNNSIGGPAPTTAVAMSILYSITGVIAILFLVVITTGALRAHRNPARYGPRTALGGRPRQSRAKGLARAMLETLPIVKFGDPEPAKAGSATDIELENGSINTQTPPVAIVPNANKEVKTEDTDKQPSTDAPIIPGATIASGLGPAQAESIKSGETARTGDGDVGCTICTEDFVAGEDVRVLPCDHKFHPACVDPWLLNVSGTCPLCRHDLNPAVPEVDEAEPTGPDSAEVPPLAATTYVLPAEDPAHRARRRASNFLHLRRLRTAPPDERIAALRELREQSREAGPAVEEVEEPSRRERMATRLRDRFRVGTTQQPAVAPRNDSPPPPPSTTITDPPRQ